MKNLITFLFFSILLVSSANAQLHVNKDGSPDMRFKENKDFYGSSYPKSSYSSPSYNNIYNSPSYNSPSNSNNSYYPSYPNKKDGSPDMRYKENKQLYGTPKTW